MLNSVNKYQLNLLVAAVTVYTLKWLTHYLVLKLIIQSYIDHRTPVRNPAKTQITNPMMPVITV